jgi:hypothetical protein
MGKRRDKRLAREKRLKLVRRLSKSQGEVILSKKEKPPALEIIRVSFGRPRPKITTNRPPYSKKSKKFRFKVAEVKLELIGTEL